MAWKDMFRELIREGKSSKEWLLDFLEEIRMRNSDGNIVISDEEFKIILDMINKL